MYVAPDAPAQLQARFTIAETDARLIDAVRVTFTLPWEELERARIAANLRASVDGVTHSGSVGVIDLPPESCRAGCTVDVRGDLTWLGPPELGIRLAWGAGLEVEYGGEPVPVPSPVTTAVVAGDAPPISRIGWLALALIAAGTVGVATAAAGPRWRTPRLLVAAAGVLVLSLAAWSTLQDGRGGWLPLPLLIAVLVPAVSLGLGLAWGVRLIDRGNPLVLPTVGWLYLVSVAFASWILVNSLPAYRPHEVAIVGFLAALPGVAAVTSAGLVQGHHRVKVGRGTPLVTAAHLLLMLVVFVIAASLLIGTLLSLSDVLDPLGMRREALLYIALSLVAFTLVAVFGFGLRMWSHGRPGVVVLGSVIVLLPSALMAVALFLPTSPFVPVVEVQLAVSILVAAGVLGALGPYLVAAPLVGGGATSALADASEADPQRNDQRG